ncbi:hypothetical protein BC940DRAFT_303554 [Gongronella butleri]|nr:hypothetical protein BC940DRAFT_303554 [Gongronella butleri]
MCDLSDPRITQTYQDIVDGAATDWMILGYNDSRDVISLYESGSQGLGEFRTKLTEEILFGYVRVEDRFILISYVPDKVSGVRRARTLVHSRSVAALLQVHHASLTASSLSDLSDLNVRTRLKLGENQVPNRSRPPSLSERKRNSLQAKRQSLQQQENIPSMPSSPASYVDTFEEAQEHLTMNDQMSADEQERLERVRLEHQRIEDQKRQDELARLEEQRRVDEENKKRAADEQKRIEEEKKRREDEERAAAEQKRIADEQRRAAEEEKRVALEQKRVAEEKKRVADEQKRAAEAERARQQQEEAEHARKQQEEADRVRKQQEEADRAQKQQEEAERVRKQQEEAERQRREQELVEQRRLQQEAEARKRADEEKKRVAEEKRRAEEQSRLEEEKRVKDQKRIEQLKKQAEDEQKRKLQQQMRQAEKTKDVLIQGVANIQSHLSPFWHRRFFTIRGKSLSLYADQLASQPLTVVDLTGTVALRWADPEVDAFLSNAFVICNKDGSSYQVFAERQQDASTIFTALQTVIG